VRVEGWTKRRTRPCMLPGICEQQRQLALHTSSTHIHARRATATGEQQQPWKVTLGDECSGADATHEHSALATRSTRPNFRTSGRADGESLLLPVPACRSIPARNLLHVPGVHLDQATPTARERVVHMHAEYLCSWSASCSTSTHLLLSLLSIAALRPRRALCPSISPPNRIFFETLAAFRHTLTMTSRVPTVQATMASSPR
jgi:hypothetical protein